MMKKKALNYSVKGIRVFAIFFVLLSVESLFASKAEAQDLEDFSITLTKTGYKFNELFKEIERQTVFKFTYYKSEIDSSDLYVPSKNKQNLKQLLDDISQKKRLYFHRINKIITVSNTRQENTTGMAAQQIISGTITDTDEVTMPGVTVVLKGTDKGTSTDFDGNFQIEAATGDTLVFSYIGYVTREMAITGSTVLNVTLEPDISELGEVVVVGYGKQKKVSMTTAVSSISNETLTSRPTKNLSSNLQGLAPGLTVVDRGGSPGNADFNILVRGITSLGDTNPLVIVDGVEMGINDVDPNNVESISVLKDAASTAIYGSRGANGVILITTKRGKVGGFSINYNGVFELQNLTVEPDHMETEAYLRLQNVAYENRGSDPLYSEEEIQNYVSGENRLKYPLPNDFFNAVIRDNAPMHRHAFSISGGTDKLKTNIMLNYFDQEGIYPNQDMQRYRLRANNDLKISEKLNVSADVALVKKDRYTFNNENGVYNRMLHASQFAVPRYPDGTYGMSNRKYNPLSMTDPEISGATDATTYSGLINLKGTWNITRGLVFNTQYAIDLSKFASVSNIPTYEIRDYFNPEVILKKNDVNHLTEYRSESLQKTWNNTLTYNRVLGVHEIDLLAGYSEISHDFNRIEAEGRNFYNNDLRDLSLSDPLNRNMNSLYQDWGLHSFFGRVKYNFREKYLLEFNMRYDGSSRFPKGNRYTFFPSIAGAWRISEEKFWEPVKPVLNEFKIRGSWGETGNQNVGLYSYFDNLDLGNYYVFNDTPVTGVRQNTFASQDLGWETTTQTNVGVDISMFRNQISLSFDWFTKKTEGILLNLPIPATVGLDPSPTNAGSVQNRGWELQLNYRNTIKEFRYGISANISDVKNEILDLAGTGPYFSNLADMFIRQEGSSIDALYGFKTDGLLTQEDIDNGYPVYASDAAPGDIKYVDISGPEGKPDGEITADDRTVLGSTVPRLTYGAAIDLGWKNFDFNMQWQGVGNKDIMLYGALVESGSWEGFTLDMAKDYWTPENTDARFPRPQKQNQKNTRPSEWWMINGAYLRLKNLQLGYTLPAGLTEKIGIRKFRLYVGGTNLLTISDLNDWGIDAETASGRGVFYPATKTYSFGMNIGL